MRFSWRFFWIGVSSAVLFVLSAPAHAQSAFEGPLAAPDAALAKPVAKPKTHQATKPAKTSKAPQTNKGSQAGKASQTGNADLKQTSPRATPTTMPDSKTPSVSDPVSFGMKWNGSNDGATQTRTQNYNGGAQGTGAEVGLKLHF